jgi:transporter family protein
MVCCLGKQFNARRPEAEFKGANMKPQLLALVAAAAWGIGGYFEKKGLPMGITLRTAVALAILGAASFPQWKTLPQAGTKPLMMMVLGGGVLAGAVGMLCFYAALKGAPLGRVMPIAFTSPLFGVIMGVWLGGETLGARELVGMLLTTGGIVLLTVK